MASIFAAKKELRRKIAEHLATLDSTSVAEQSGAITRQVLEHPQYKIANTVSVYLSTPTEVSTLEILQDIFAKGKQCYVPRFHKDCMDMVRLESMQDFDSLPTTMWNIKQPAITDKRPSVLHSGIPLDVIVMPGVAFTISGKRLGHGKGYYDTFLAKHTQLYSRCPHMLALCLKEQIVDDLPVTDKDVIVDKVITAD